MLTQHAPTWWTRLASLALALALVLCVAPAMAQDQADAEPKGETQEPAEVVEATAEAAAADDSKEKVAEFNATADDIKQRMLDAEQELKTLNALIAAEKSPLNKELRTLEEELKKFRREFEKVSAQAANRALEAKKLDDRIKGREKSAKFISDRFDQYIREFKAGTHIAELQRYDELFTDAENAMENRDLSTRDRFDIQKAVVEASITRLEELQGGVIYNGRAIDTEGVLGTQGAIATGTFVQYGPVVVFTDTTGKLQGMVQQRVGTLEPEVLPFPSEKHAGTVQKLVEGSAGTLTLDTTLGDAQTAELIQEETLLDKFNAGGPVMYPILGLGILTILVGLYKWIAITLTPSVSRGKLARLLGAVLESNKQKAKELAGSMRGPTGRMLRAGVEHLGEPRDLIEEVMYEQVLSSKIKINRLLPVIAICAASAPLLGLLGTVSGIINTFKMMQISGGADMQNVSGGISEALLTTMFGLIVAIPSLILHVFLTRKARGVVDGMEMAGVALINEIMKSQPPGEGDRLAELDKPSPDGDTPPSDPTPAEDSDQGSGDGADAEDSTEETYNEKEKAQEHEKEPALVESRG